MGIKITAPSIADMSLIGLEQGGSTLALAVDTRTGGEGVAARITPLTLQKFADSFDIVATAHGLTAADLGKPIHNDVILDDTDAAHFTSGVLVSIPDANTLRIVHHGKVQFSDTLVEPGYSIAVNGPYVYWDLSAGTYVSQRPVDSANQNTEILYMTNFVPGAAVASVLGRKPQLVGGGGIQAMSAMWLWDELPVAGVIADEHNTGTPRPIQPGRARDFDGVDDYVMLPSMSQQITSELTVAAWILHNGGAVQSMVAADYQFATNNNSWFMAIDGTGTKIRCVVTDSTTGDTKQYSSVQTITPGEWNHVAFTFAQDDLKLFINGVETAVVIGSENVVNQLLDSGNAVYVGAYQDGNSNFNNMFTGPIHDVRIWNRTLTPTELADIHARTVDPGNGPELAMYPANLLCHLHLEEGSGTSCPDASGNGNDGTAFGISEPAFNYESNDVPSSFQNEIGFSGSATPYVPANSTDVTTDPSGGVLEFQGVVPKDAVEIGVTGIDFNPGPVPSPWSRITSPPTNYTFGDILPQGWSKRIGIGGVEDQFFVRSS